VLATYLESSDRVAREQLMLALRSRSTAIAHAFIEMPAEPPKAVRSAQLAGFGAETSGATARPALPAPVPAATPPGPAPALPSPANMVEPAGLEVARAADPTSGNVVSLFSTSYWDTTEIRLAALGYFALMVTAILVALSILRSLNRFRNAAYEIVLGRVGDNALASRNGVRELTGVAHLLDRLVFDLRYMSDQMRLTAAENAHSLRTPLATMRTAMGAIRRTLPPDEPRAQRALKIIDISLDRLSHVVNSVQRNDTTMANLVAAPRSLIDLTELTHDMIGELEERAQSRNIRIRCKLSERVIVHASSAALKVALLDVLASAVNASSRYGEIAVALEHDESQARLTIEDRGSDADSPELFFQHDFEPAENPLEPTSDDTATRLGLWNVKRTIEAFADKCPLAAISTAERRSRSRCPATVSSALVIISTHLFRPSFC
jgi:two-component system, OmpR family, sensor histidine kinase ChvG